MRACGFVVGFLFFTLSLWAAQVGNLRCEYRVNPLGVDEKIPRLSWGIQSGLRGDCQTAYQVIVSSSSEKLKKDKRDLWDTGKVDSNEFVQIIYRRKPLESGRKYFWKVRVWDKNGKSGKWSEPAFWSMGLLEPQNWKPAQWIAFKDNEQWKKEWKQHKDSELNQPHDATWPNSSWPWLTGKDSTIFALHEMAYPQYDPSPLFRKTFVVKQKIKHATLFICGLGYYEAFINGKRVGDQVLDPEWTNFDQRSFYATYDVSELIKEGNNAIGAMLGRGQYNPICNDIWGLSKSSWIDQPKLIALLNIEYENGSKTIVATDDSWKTSGGPIVYDDTRHGELYDARLEQKDWSTPAFDNGGWKHAFEVNFSTRLESQMMPPIRCFTPIAPVKTYVQDVAKTIYDLGKNISGWARVTVKGNEGAKVLVEYSETPSDSMLIDKLPPSRFNYDIKDKHYASFYDKGLNIRQQNGYILKGGEDETFECHFSYKGFQFVRVTVEGGVTVEKVEGIPVHTDVEIMGDFSCSNSLINKIQHNAVSSLLNNYHSIATDCPHREKQGWTADNYMSSEAAMYNFNMALFYSKWLTDQAGTQSSEGCLNTVAPSTSYDKNQSTTWPAAIAFLPWDLYSFYGDTLPMARNFDVMRRFAESSLLRQVDGKPEIIRDVLGDWVAPLMELKDGIRNNTMAPPEGTTFYGTASHYLVVKRLAEIAGVLRKPAEQKELEEWSGRIAKAFNKEYFDRDAEIYRGENPTPYRQSTNVVSLQYGLVSDEFQDAVEKHLIEDIEAKGKRLATGFLGTMALMQYLPELHPELAYHLATQKDYPGWGYMVEQGANTMWEAWDGYDSRNHTPFCLISAYFYKYLAGIQYDMATPGFEHIVIKPSFVGDLKWVYAHHDCLYGRIESKWMRENGKIQMDVNIPVNTWATVYIPACSETDVLESGNPVQEMGGIEFSGMENGNAVFNVKSGKYHFQVKHN